MKVSVSILAFGVAALLSVPAYAADTVLAPATGLSAGEPDATYIPAPDLYEPDYFVRRTAEKDKATKNALKEAQGYAAANAQRRQSEISSDQAAIKARVQDVVSQPGDYGTRIDGLKAAPPVVTDPQTQPPAETGGGAGTTPVVSPGTGGGDTRGGGGSAAGPGAGDGGDTRGDTRSVLEQMMDSVR